MTHWLTSWAGGFSEAVVVTTLVWFGITYAVQRATRRQEAQQAPRDVHRPLDNPGSDDEPWHWHCQVCAGPCKAVHR